jgi:hypothetical protein
LDLSPAFPPGTPAFLCRQQGIFRARLRATDQNSDKLTGIIAAGSYGGHGHWGYLNNRNPRALGRCRRSKEILMKKALTTVLAAATIAVSLAASATDASAQRRGGAIAAGVALGFVGGALVGSAIANSRPAYVVAPAPGYVVYTGYAAPLPGPNCYWTRQPVYDPYGNVVGWRGRAIAVCQ